MNEDFQALKVNHQLLKDSLTVFVKIVEKKDELITNKDKQITLFQDNEKKYQIIIEEKDKQISEWKRKYRKEKTLKHVGLGTSLIAIIGLGILVL
jgi:hypothetical protein